MIDIRNLELAIKNIIQPLVAGEMFATYQGEKREINIYTGILPPDPEETIIPAITIRIPEANNSLDRKVLTLLVSIGIFDKDSESGYVKISEITQKIFEKILEIGILENKFEVLSEAKWKHPETQPYPYYLAFMTFNIVYQKDYREDYKEWIDGGD